MGSNLKGEQIAQTARAIADFEAYASAVDADGHKMMTYDDLMSLYGVRDGGLAWKQFSSQATGKESSMQSSSRGISLSEFIVLSSITANSSSSLTEQFKLMDKNMDGRISFKEFTDVIGHTVLLDSSDNFIQRHFGADGTKTLSYRQFCSLMEEMKDVVIRIKWKSLKPAPDDTVRLSSIGLLLIKTLGDDLPPILARNLANPSNCEIKCTFSDYVDFESVMDRLEDFEELMEAEVDKAGHLTREAFEKIVSSLTKRRSGFLGISSKGSSLVLDSLFTWLLDGDKSGVLSKDEVRAILTVGHGSKTPVSPPRPLSLVENIILGASSAAIAGTVVFPMDTVKARLMAGGGGGIISTFASIVKAQGVAGLYRGLPAQVLGVMPEKVRKPNGFILSDASDPFFSSQALKLTLYNTLKSKMMDPETQHATYGQEALAGSITATVQVLITNPYELIKIRQQTTPGEPISTTVSKLGLRGLTQGMSACLLRDIPFNATYFTSYAALKDSLKPVDDGPLTPLSLMAAGLGAGLVAGSITTPFDVIKTKMQSDRTGEYRSLFDCIRKMHRDGGAGAFFR